MSFPWYGVGSILDCVGGGRLMRQLSLVRGDMLKHNLREMLAHGLPGGMR